MFSDGIVSIILMFALRMFILMPTIILHEVAHGYVAYRLGDPTAKYSGRLTLNPLAHIDLWGTILLPALLLIGSGGTFSFGYAKPVPINPRYFKNEREGMMLTGAAGPAVNILIAVVFGLVLRFIPETMMQSSIGYIVYFVLLYFVQINLVLAFFNLIPIPPLDGSRIVQKFLPSRLRHAYHQLEAYGFVIVIGITYFVPSIFGTYFAWTVDPILRLLIGN